jgi:phosphatidylglycerophosphate synthase
MGKESDGILKFPIVVAHEKLHLSPNQLSLIGLGLGIAAAALVFRHELAAGMGLMALSQVVDGLDGGVARRYNLKSPSGKRTEMLCDRLCEGAMLLALALVGYAAVPTAALAMTAILCVTIVEPFSGFDPGFKRFVLYFGYAATVLFDVRGFQIAMQVIFWANLSAAAFGMILADYRLQEEIDRQAMLRREREIRSGVPQPPDDPPSFLSRIFS